MTILTKFFRKALILCSVLAACALAAPEAEAQVTPTGLSVEKIGPNKVRATWTDNGNAWYQIAYDSTNFQTNNLRFSTKRISATTIQDGKVSTDIMVPSDGHYHFVIRACTGSSGNNCGGYGAPGGAPEIKLPPRQMASLTLTPGDSELVLRYTGSKRTQDRNGAAHRKGAFRGYDIHYTASTTVAANAGISENAATGWKVARSLHSALGWTISGLTNFTTYRVRVRPVSSNGAGEWLVKTGIPGGKLSKLDTNKILVDRRVSGLNVSGKTETGTATTFSTPGAQNYLVKVCRGNRNTNCTEVQTSGSSGKLLTGLQGGAQYHVQVKARSSNGRQFDSDWSDWIGPITKPTHRLSMGGATYTVTEGDSQSHPLTVNEGGAITTDLTVYAKYDPAESGGSQSPAPAIIKAGTKSFPIIIPADDNENAAHKTFHIRELEDQETYAYIMSAGSGQVAVTVLDDDAPKVTGLSVTVNVRTLEVRWNASDGPVTEYEVQYRKVADTDWQSVTRTNQTSTSEDLLVDGGELYTVRVRANDGQTGDGNGWGPWVEAASGRTDYVVGWPQAAITINEGDEAGRRLIVAKSVPVRMTTTIAYGGDNLSDVKDGRVTTFSAEKGNDLVVVLATPKTGDGNEPDETFTVTINDGAGYSVDTHPILTVTIEDNDPPAAPGVTQPEADDAQYIEWTAPADGPIGGYQVQKLEIASVDASVTEADWAGTAPTNVAPPTATRHRLPTPDGKLYVFRVRAHDGQSGDGNGWGEWSRPTEGVFPRASRGSWEVRARDARPGGIMEGYPRYQANFNPNAKPVGVVLRWDTPDLVAYKTRYATPHAGTKVGEPAAVTWSGVRYDTRSGLTYDVALAPSNDCPAGSARDFGSVQRTRNREADGVKVGSAWMPNDCTYIVTVTANYAGACPAGAGKCTREYGFKWPGRNSDYVDPGVTPIVMANNTTAFEAVEKYGRPNEAATIAVRLYGRVGGGKIRWPGSGNSSCEGTGNDITVNVSTIGGTGNNAEGVAATPPADTEVTSHSSFSAYTEKWAIGGADYGVPTMNGAAITSLTFACEAGAEELRKEFTIPIMDDGIDDSDEAFAVKLEVATTTTRPGRDEKVKAALTPSGGLIRVHILNHDYLSALVIEQRVGDEWSRLDYGTLTDTPSVTVPYETTHIRVTPTAGSAGSTLKVGSPLVSIASGGTSDAWALDVGANSFGIEVRESDGATKTYKIAVTRQEQSALSANADLKALAVGTASNGNGPWTKLDIGEFSAGTTTYTVTVPHTATNVRIAASTADSNATHRKGPVASLRPGDGSYWTQNFALGEGANDLAVEVTAEDGKTKKTYTVTVTRGAAQPLTVAFENAPAEHDGRDPFAIDLRFSEALGEGGIAPTAASFRVQAGGVAGVERGSAGLWRVRVQPKNWKDVTVTLAPPSDCAAAGAVCTADGRALSNTVTATVGGPVRIRIEGARAKEGQDKTLDFPVTLNRAVSHAVSVAYATADDTATAGADYTATSGTLVFAAGETAKTVSVPVLDDAIDEGKEILRLHLSNPRGAYLRSIHRRARGIIVNDDPLQRAWLSRFGRTAATHVTDAVGDRLRGGSGTASHLTIGGYRLPLGQKAAETPAPGGEPVAKERTLAAQLWGPLPDAEAAPAGRLAALVTDVARGLGMGPGGTTPDAPWPDPRLGQAPALHLPDLRQVLLGSAFRLNLNAADAGAGAPRLTAWGRFAGTTFDGRAGELALDGDVFTGTVGVDGTWDRLLAGVAVAHSRGTGGFTRPGLADRGTGDLEQTLTSLHPYLRYAVTDRLDVWSLVGYGWGELDLELANGVTVETDTTLVMGAFGGRGILLAPADTGGFQLATRTDAMLTRTSSDAVANSAATDADAHRLRVILEGSRAVTWADGRSLTPTLELGVRHDWGDAETGFGLELGGRVQYADPALGLTIEGAVRGLLAHEDEHYQEWGASGTVRLAPGPNGQGLALTLAPTWGATASGVDGLWARQTTQGLAPQGTPATPAGQLAADVGYGFAAFDTGLLTPYAGTVLSAGADRTYRVGARWASVTGLALTLEGRRQEPAGPQPVNQGLRLQAAWGF